MKFPGLKLFHKSAEDFNTIVGYDDVKNIIRRALNCSRLPVLGIFISISISEISPRWSKTFDDWDRLRKYEKEAIVRNLDVSGHSAFPTMFICP
jgi:hypothetical protein